MKKDIGSAYVNGRWFFINYICFDDLEETGYVKVHYYRVDRACYYIEWLRPVIMTVVDGVEDDMVSFHVWRSQKSSRFRSWRFTG